MKKITVSILTTLLMLSMVFSSSVFAAEKEQSAWDSFLGLFSAKTAATSDVGVEYRGHVQNKGDFPLDGSWIQGPDQLGTVGESLRLEAFWIKLTNEVPAGLHIQYRVHVQNKGWMAPVEDGALAGTQGESLQIESVEIKLVDDAGNPAVGYSVEYRGHIQNKGDMPADGSWYKDGEQLGTVGEFLRLEALEVKIVQTKADMTAYNAAVAAAGALTEADYTADSWAALETALATVVTEDNTQAEVDAATAAINDAIDGLVKVTKISSLEATGVKTLKVNFNQALTAEQQAATTIVVKKGSVTTNLTSTTFAADGLSAVITTSSKLTKGTYTASTTIDGAASTADVTVVDEKVSAITILSDTAPQVSGHLDQAVILYEVTNQYGEKMTGQTINWSNSTGSTPISDDKAGKLVIQNTASAGVNFIPGAVVYITGVHTGSGTVVNDSVTIGVPSLSDKVNFKGVYSLDDKEIAALPAGFSSGDYVLLYEVKDQYGNKIASPTFSDLVFTVDNPVFISATLNAASTVTIDGTVYQAVALVPGTNAALGGTANISVISKFTGATSSYAITADSLSMLTTLTMTAPADMVSLGETVEIPFEAYDQNGVQLTKYDDLAGNVTFTKPTGTTFDFVEQADGTAKLEFNTTGLGSDGIVTIATLVTGKASFSALNIDVQEAATPSVIVGLDSGISTAVALGLTFDVEATDFIIEDQYGRVMDDSLITNLNTFIVYTPYNMSNVAGTPTDFTFAGTSISVDDGSVQDVSKIEFALYDDTLANTGTLIAGSELDVPITVTTQSDYASYEVADFGLMYNNATPGTATDADFDKTVKVYGVKANGTKVLLPTSEFTVATNGKLDSTTANGTISDVAASGYAASDFLAADGVTAVTIPVKVTVQVLDTAASGAIKATVVKNLTVSNADSTGTTITMNDTAFGGKYNIAAGTTALNTLSANAIEEVLDQYGVAMTPATTAVISNVTMATGSTFAVGAANITGAVVGDTFTATFTYGTTEYTANFLVH